MSDTETTERSPLRDRVKDWARGPWLLPVATLIGFIEHTFILAPMEPVFLPLMVMRPKRAWMVAAALLLGNVLGGLLMYWLGAMFAEEAIAPLMKMLDATDAYQETLRTFDNDGFATLFMIGITPFPFQVGVAAAGAAGYSLPLFILAVALSRSIRYFALAGLVMLVGERAEALLKKHQLEILLIGGALFAAFVIYMIFF